LVRILQLISLPPLVAAAGALRRRRDSMLTCFRHGLRASVLAALAAVVTFPAAAEPQDTPSRASGKNAPIALSGCVSGKPAANGAFTFQETEGAKYRLSGKGVRKFAGQKVELVGGSPRGLTIRGGLLPSPNIAAQAGALDPAQVAIASQPGGTATSGTGADLPEFRVARVRALDGACQ
jgi:hypothetical protein